MKERVNHIRTARDTVINPGGLQQYSLLQVTAEILQDAIKWYQGMLGSMKQELALSEESHLHIRHKDDRYYFSCKGDRSNQEQSISDDPIRIQVLARRSILTTSIQAVEHRLKLLERMEGNAEEVRCHLKIKKQLDRFADAGIDLSRVLFTREQNEWMDELFTPNPYNRGSLTAQTTSGIWMRSKSEARIGSSLEEIGVPYRNDDLVKIIADGKGVPNRDSYFADFKVPNFLGGITVHEHFGAFQMDNYADNALQRLEDYRYFTVVEIEGRPVADNEFTWSFESDVSSEESRRKLIRKLLLPL